MAEPIAIKRHTLHQGDCVRLKSGGPLMLVGISDAEIDNSVTCIWFAGPRGRKMHSGTFIGKSLELVALGDQAKAEMRDG